MSQGSLISFMLYQSSLSSSFDALGYCFTGMSAAVGECLCTKRAASTLSIAESSWLRSTDLHMCAFLLQAPPIRLCP